MSVTLISDYYGTSSCQPCVDVPKRLFIGGPAVDLHIHDAHFIRLLCGMPKAVQTIGRMNGDPSRAGKVLDTFSTQFYFDDPALVVTADCGIIRQQGRPFTHGFEINLEKATIFFDFAALGDNKPALSVPLTLLDHKGNVLQPELGSGDPVDAFVAELTEATKAARTGKPSAMLDGQLARDALILAQRQTQSVVKQKKVAV